ncbi:oligopeptide transport system permease protein [Lachnospiraceae bacterium XBB1006]|nr:oligopeptide transport system permease protein [Lachnospiraceae bacterium XBB1006]
MNNEFEKYGLSEEELFARIDNRSASSEKITAPRYSYWKSVFRVFFRKKINYFILGLLAVVLLLTYVYPLFVNYDPYANLTEEAMKHLNPSKAIDAMGFSLHSILGTGAQGQSTFDAIWFGSRISVSLALVCAAINMTLGVAVGCLWGFVKKIDMFMIEAYNIIANVPMVLLISVMVMIFSATFWSMVLAMCLTEWLFIAFFIRTQVIIIRDREYNLASKCLGTPVSRILTRNVLPFMTSVIVTYLAAEIPSYISYEVFLSYIGMGLTEDSLGKIIQAAQSAMITPGWEFEFWAPVAVSAIITVVLYVAGQNLGDAADPRTHM